MDTSNNNIWRLALIPAIAFLAVVLYSLSMKYIPILIPHQLGTWNHFIILSHLVLVPFIAAAPVGLTIHFLFKRKYLIPSILSTALVAAVVLPALFSPRLPFMARVFASLQLPVFAATIILVQILLNKLATRAL